MASKFLEDAEVIANDKLASRIWELTLYAPRTAAAVLPGQFVHMQVDGGVKSMLRRPFSVFDAVDDVITIIYEVKGAGTEIMTKFEIGDKVSLIAPCGNSWLSTFSETVYAPPSILTPTANNTTPKALPAHDTDTDAVRGEEAEDLIAIEPQDDFPDFKIAGDNDSTYFEDLKSTFFDFVKKKRQDLPTDKVKRTLSETFQKRNSSVTISRALLVGGGLGASPLFMLANRLVDSNVTVDVVIGAQTQELLVLQEPFEFINLNNFICATDDGSFGYSGFCTDPAEKLLADNSYDYVATCGPAPVMKKVFELARGRVKKVEVSCEERMACGVGACKTCVVDTVLGKVKSCECGPVFDAEVMAW